MAGMTTRKVVRCLPAFALALLWPGSPAADASSTTTGRAPDTGLRYWEWQGDGVLFRLTQRLPDQTRAFFLARGFDPDSADLIATRCVFQSMFKNTAEAGSVTIDLDDWRILVSGDKERALMTRETWTRQWQTRKPPQSARIAFEWSLLPTRQVYGPGDYNWGMTSYGLPPRQRFDLVFSWTRDGKVFTARLKDIECTPDLHPEPK